MINYNKPEIVIDDDHTWYTDNLAMPRRIRILRTGSGDWTGLYVDGKLTREGHNLDVMHAIMDVLGANTDIRNVTVKDNYLDDYANHCPGTWPSELETALSKKSNGDGK